MQVIHPATLALVVMFVTRLLGLILVAVSLALAGCKCQSCRCPPATPVAPCSYAVIEPPATPPDLASLVPVCVPDEDGEGCDFPCLLPGPTEAFEALDHRTCQCRAVTNTSVSNAIEIERHWASVLIGCEGDAVVESLCLTRSLLSLQAMDLRNASAASALSSFYLLAGVEATEDHVELGIREVQDALTRLDNLDEQGLTVPNGVDRGALEVRLDDLRDKRLQLCFARIQLNGQLKRHLGCPLDQRRLFWPQVDWTPNLEPLDADVLVAEGLARRADVRSLSLVRCKLNMATIPVARQVLKVIDGTLGAVTPSAGILSHLRCGDCKEHEVAVRCRQLTMLERDARELATAKIKSAAYKVAVQQDRTRLAKQAVDQRRERLAELEKLRDAEDVSIFEISAARGRLFEAEASLVEKIVELKMAEVALRETQGALAAECGYVAHVCNEHCCTGCCRGYCGCGGGACLQPGAPCGCDRGGCVESCGLNLCGSVVE